MGLFRKPKAQSAAQTETAEKLVSVMAEDIYQYFSYTCERARENGKTHFEKKIFFNPHSKPQNALSWYVINPDWDTPESPVFAAVELYPRKKNIDDCVSQFLKEHTEEIEAETLLLIKQDDACQAYTTYSFHMGRDYMEMSATW